MDRQATISIALGGAKFALERFEAVERFSEPFVIMVEGFCADEIDFLPHLGKPVCLDAGDMLEHVRYFHGLLTEVDLIDADINGSHYRLTLRPWFHFLERNRDYRIFQDQSVLDIAKKVFADQGIKDVDFSKIHGSYAKRLYCVQYKESDFSFLSRLFEDEGIYYYFRHEKNAHVLVLCDQKSAHKPAARYETVQLLPVTGDKGGMPDTFWDWTERVSTSSLASVTLRSFDFTKPQSPVEGQSQAVSHHPGDAQELYEYLGDFVEKDHGDKRGKIRLAAARAQRRVYTGTGDVIGLACGGLFSLKQAAIGRFNREYLITAIRHRVEAEAHRSGETREPRRVEIEAVTSDTLYRPALKTPKPMAYGPETATVTGPRGEVIYVDEHGRVKVRFHWDRSPDQPGKTSCWMRVSHHSAGAGFGNVVLPRVGQEVIVDFLDGDPDRPIITGRVYNSQHTHTYGLPAHKTRSQWRSETVGSPGDYGGAEKPPPSGPGFNEIRFEDKGGSEELFIRAQRNMKTDVRLDKTLGVQRDEKVIIGRDRSTQVKRNDVLFIKDGDQFLKIGKGQRVEKIKKNDSLIIEDGDKSAKLKSGNYTIKLEEGKLVVDAKDSILLKVGDNSSILIDDTGITIKGLVISNEAKAIFAAKAEVELNLIGSGSTTVKGKVVKIN